MVYIVYNYLWQSAKMAKASLAFDWSSLTPIDANISPSSKRNINSAMTRKNYYVNA